VRAGRSPQAPGFAGEAQIFRGEEVTQEGTLYVSIGPLEGGKFRVTTISAGKMEEVVVGADWTEYEDGKAGEEAHPLFWNPGKLEIGGLRFAVEREEDKTKLVHYAENEEIVFVFDKEGILISYEGVQRYRML